MYETDVTDAQWQIMEKLFPNANRKRKHQHRSVVNALFYLVKTGCQWRMLPKDFPEWQVVYYYFKKWHEMEIIDDINLSLLEKKRKNRGRASQPSLLIMDCQSVKTTMLGGIRGYDGNKKINGRKRHIAVDSQGSIVDCIVHSANQHESQTTELLLKKLKADQFQTTTVIADGGYRGQVRDVAKTKYNIDLQVVKRNEDKKTFTVQPIRWIVERTIAWFNGYRRLAKDFERFLETSRAMVLLFAIKLSLNEF